MASIGTIKNSSSWHSGLRNYSIEWGMGTSGTLRNKHFVTKLDHRCLSVRFNQYPTTPPCRDNPLFVTAGIGIVAILRHLMKINHVKLINVRANFCIS